MSSRKVITAPPLMAGLVWFLWPAVPSFSEPFFSAISSQLNSAKF